MPTKTVKYRMIYNRTKPLILYWIYYFIQSILSKLLTIEYNAHKSHIKQIETIMQTKGFKPWSALNPTLYFPKILITKSKVHCQLLGNKYCFLFLFFVFLFSFKLGKKSCPFTIFHKINEWCVYKKKRKKEKKKSVCYCSIVLFCFCFVFQCCYLLILGHR